MLSGCFIEGRVVDENGLGVSGVTVTLSGDQSRTTTTNNKGIYYFGDLRNLDIIFAGSYTITPSKLGYIFTPVSANVTVTLQTEGGLENIPWPVEDVDFEAIAPVHLADVEDGRIFQRDNKDQYSLPIVGSYRGNPDGIEARVVMDSSAEEVVPWTIIDDDPTGGTFSGTLEDIPQGGWYNIQVRFSNDQSCIDESFNKFGVGVLVACTGQSHIDYWFDNWIPGPSDTDYEPPTANDLTRMYRHAKNLQWGPDWVGWQPVTGVGATVFANILQESLGIPVGLLDYGVGGAALWQKNTTDLAAVGLPIKSGWWLADDSGIFPEDDNYTPFKAGLESIGNRIEALLWIQGHAEAMAGESTANYKSGLNELFMKMRTDTGVTDLPIFISLVTRQSGTAFLPGMPIITDEKIQRIRNAEEQYCAEDSNTYLGCTTIDIPLSWDNLHHSKVGQELQAKRLAQAVLHILLNSGDYTYHRGPQLASYEIVDFSTIDVHIIHCSGTDFTPSSGIQGFEVMFGENALVPETSERYDADTIRLTISDDTDMLTGIRYLYGGNPGGLDLKYYADTYVHDNSPLQLPLEGGVLP